MINSCLRAAAGTGGARRLPGHLYYGGAGLSKGAELLATIATRVQCAPLSPAEIEAYVATEEPLQCAGGFALEGRGGALVERIEGCFRM